VSCQATSLVKSVFFKEIPQALIECGTFTHTQFVYLSERILHVISAYAKFNGLLRDGQPFTHPYI